MHILAMLNVKLDTHGWLYKCFVTEESVTSPTCITCLPFSLIIILYWLLINVNNNIDKNIRKSVLKTQIKEKASQTFGLIYVNTRSTKLVDITCSFWK